MIWVAVIAAALLALGLLLLRMQLGEAAARAALVRHVTTLGEQHSAQQHRLDDIDRFIDGMRKVEWLNDRLNAQARGQHVT